MKAWLIFLLLAAPALAAQGVGHTPADADSLAWQQKPGAQLPLQTALTDEAGHAVTLRTYVGHGPIILDMGYFRCPSLCGLVRADLFNALGQAGLVAGRDYTLLAVSIDPAETSAVAAQAKQTDRAQYPLLITEDSHYLIAGPAAIAAIANAVGFRDRFDARFGQFMHPSGLTFLTGSGAVSGYLLGVGYTPGDLRAAVLRARGGGIARAALPVLLLCFHFDPNTGRYTLAIMKLLRVMGLLTVATIAALLVVLHRSGRGADA